MEELTEYAAIKLLNAPLIPNFRVPPWFKSEHVTYLFPIDRRPAYVCSNASTPMTPSTSLTPSSPDESFLRVSKRRGEDLVRREAMHTLLTSWDKSARSTARDIVNILFRGHSLGIANTSMIGLNDGDSENVANFLALVNGDVGACSRVIADFKKSQRPFHSQMPIRSICGYSVTETVGPLAMLSRLCRTRSLATIWVKRKKPANQIQIVKRTGVLVLFDRYMNIVYIPTGNANDNWQFIRGSMIALVQA